jgi:hypothetical protein
VHVGDLVHHRLDVIGSSCKRDTADAHRNRARRRAANAREPCSKPLQRRSRCLWADFWEHERERIASKASNEIARAYGSL